MTPSEAKAWLIAQITTEASRAATPLDPLEAGMLHYSESERTPANYETLLAAFDTTHDERAYQARITAILRNLHGAWRDEANPKLAQWRQAVEALKGQDHYLLVLLAASGNTHPPRSPARNSLLRIFLIALLVTALVTLLLGYLARRY